MADLREVTVRRAYPIRSLARYARRSALLGLIAMLAAAAHSLYASHTTAQIAVAMPAVNVSRADIPVTPALPAPDLSPEQMGDLHMAHHRYQEAIEAYRQSPLNTAELWNKIGIANQQMYILAEAQKSYENSLKLDDKNPEVINNLGTVFYSLKQYAKAEKLYRKALKLSPKSAVIYKNLGTAFLAENKQKQGWDCFQSALQIDPQVFEGNGHYHIGDPTPSQQLGAMNFYLAKSCLQAGMKERAIEYLRLAMDEGFTDRKKILSDRQFDSLNEMPAFQQLLIEHKNN